jgi:peptide chain release factor 2
MVKDLRTGEESSQPQNVLDGDLDKFMAAALAARVHGENTDVSDIE